VKPIKIAIIGFGKIAEDQHVPAISKNPRLDLVATSSRSGEGLDRKFTDWRELLKSVDGLEAAAITTPPGPRYEIARECIEAGIHCLLEKPPTTGLAEIADLECLAQAQRVTLFTTWHAQHHSTVDTAAKALAGKRIKSLDIRWHEDVNKWHPGQQWIWQAGGFGVFDPGINAFSIATRIFPGGLFVRSADLSFPENSQTPIAAEVTLTSPVADGELRASLDWRATKNEEWTISVETSDGLKLSLEDGGSKLSIDGRWQEDSGPGEYPAIYDRFVDLIDERRSLVDVAPMRLVADCFMTGRRRTVAPVYC
jgi:predicted dehydrogenase